MKNFGKIMSIMFVILMAFGALAAFPEVTQVSYDPSPAVPGSTITLIVQLQNPDSSIQKGVTVNVEDIYPFTIKTTDQNPNPSNIGDIAPYSNAIATFTVYVDPTAENQTYDIPITITTFGDPSGKKTTAQIIISGKEPLLKVISTSNEKLLPGEEKEISLTIQNVGTSTAYDVVVEMQEDRTITATGTVVERDITPLGAATSLISEIKAGEQKTAQLRVSVSNTATIKNYTLPVKVSYRNAAGARTTDTSYIGLKVFGTAELDADLKEVVGAITAGQRTEIVIEVFNKGLGKAEFTLAEISASDATVEKTKQFIGTLGPNDVDTIKTGIVFNKSGSQTVNVTISYQDADSTMKTTTIKVAVNAAAGGDGGINPILIIVVVLIIGVLVWNFYFRGKKKK